jgi:hypothetical protein
VFINALLIEHCGITKSCCSLTLLLNNNVDPSQTVTWRSSPLDKTDRTQLILLKVLSSKMDPAEIMIIGYDVVKERGAEVFWKNPPVPHPVRAL